MKTRAEAIARATELMPKYERFCKTTYAEWSKTNPPILLFMFQYGGNAFDAHERRMRDFYEQVHPRFVTWWKERGFTLCQDGPRGLARLKWKGQVVSEEQRAAA